MLEVFLTFMILTGLYFWNRKFGNSRGFLPWEKTLLQVLYGYHMLFAGVFTWYLLEHGGDAVRYWSLEADVSQNPVNWTDYWGHGTFFLQWLHYWPSKVLGLEFWFGNVLYAGISWLGFREIFSLMRPFIANSGNRVLVASGWLILFLPNAHFWSSGVGKEAWLLLGLALVLKGFSSLRVNWFIAVFGLLLAFWVRPAFGIVLGSVSFVFVLADRNLGLKTKALVGLIGLLAGSLGIRKLSVMMHLEDISLASIQQFSASQLDFLAGFRASSEIPMAEYNWLQRFWALLFRPNIWEASDFWSFAAALENMVGLALTISGLFAVFSIPKSKLFASLPKFLILALFVCLGMCVVYGLTLNNLGIIMRMKSTYMIFWYFSFWMLVVLRIKSIIAGKDKD
ncbi:hypothetical protein C943_02193 [Mariniradius saccharolyticus AK6]|uniref:Glycosyltransferase RgtA/B/C/D-like domain-containing protein n=1 Tax=Mariniradius saccharolyticus AK6 TaxID=1239962 RepID=M7XA70_9BACT|nr:hypothetical protein [Mariniradius saccharolyticus]EMS31538.1 hypothetical protein C943_02193 [Mariniradius saccharolyticus AK6]